MAGRGRPRKHQKTEEIAVGSVVWGKLRGYPWWPAIVVDASLVSVDACSIGQLCLFWFGDYKISKVPQNTLEGFKKKFMKRSQGKWKGLREAAILEAIKEEAQKLGYAIDDWSPDTIRKWAEKGFRCASLTNCKSCPPNLLISNYIREKMKGILVKSSKPKPTSPEKETSGYEKTTGNEKSSEANKQIEEATVSQEAPKCPEKATTSKKGLRTRHNEVHQRTEEITVGSVVWGKLRGYPWWPAIVVDASFVSLEACNIGQLCLFWFGDYKISKVPQNTLEGFKKKFMKRSQGKWKGLREAAILEAIKEEAQKLGYAIDDWSPDTIRKWAEKGFRCASLTNCKSCPPNLLISNYIREKMKGILMKSSKPKPTSPEKETTGNEKTTGNDKTTGNEKSSEANKPIEEATVSQAAPKCPEKATSKEGLRTRHNEVHQRTEEITLGSVVWGKLRGYPWWPAIVVDASFVSPEACTIGQLCLFWFGDYKISKMPQNTLEGFKEKFMKRSQGKWKGLRETAILEAIKEEAQKLGYAIDDWSPDTIRKWAEKGFRRASLTNCKSCPPNVISTYIREKMTRSSKANEGRQKATVSQAAPKRPGKATTSKEGVRTRRNEANRFLPAENMKQIKVLAVNASEKLGVPTLRRMGLSVGRYFVCTVKSRHTEDDGDDDDEDDDGCCSFIDVQSVTREYIKEIGPVDLLLGGSDAAKPGDIQAAAEFYRIKGLLEVVFPDHSYYWLWEECQKNISEKKNFVQRFDHRNCHVVDNCAGNIPGSESCSSMDDVLWCLPPLFTK